ncbi:hypothetical protein CCP4SC76_3150002 [Gammaproteobacteria bacterium]
MAKCKAVAGKSPFDSASAGSTSALMIPSDTPCWQDIGDAFWWESDTGFLGAFTNVEYATAVRTVSDDPGLDGKVTMTHEFAFVIKVNESCIGRLKEGDSVAITIGESAWPGTYQSGDKLMVAMVGGEPISLHDGRDAQAILNWSVAGSVSGRAPDWVLDLANPQPVVVAGATLRLASGGIPWQLGDHYSIGIESASLRWRKDSGAWSGHLPIADGTPVDSGLSLTVLDGSAPSWVVGDRVSISAEQVFSPSNVIEPTEAGWKWAGDSASITMTVPGTVTAVAVCNYRVPAGAVLTLTVNGADRVWNAHDGSPLVVLLDSPTPNPQITLTLANSPGGGIGWLWAGDPITLPLPCAQLRTWSWDMKRGGGLNPSASLVGFGIESSSTWEGWLSPEHLDALVTAIRDAKRHGDWPALWVPHTRHHTEAWPVLLPDKLEVRDVFDFQPNDSHARKLAFSLALTPWRY